jgi:hypothetical protein
VTIRRLVIAIAFLSLVFMSLRPMIDSDTWWHLRTGQWILEHRALPEVDRFSFTREGEPWYYPGWLSEILMAEVFSVGGLTALNLLFSGVVLSAFALVYLTLDGNPFVRAVVLVLAAGASEIYWSARPQLFTFLFCALFYLCLRKFLWENKNVLWVLPPVMALWVNIHPGFAAGYILLLVAVIGQGVKYLVQGSARPPETGRKLCWLVGILLACLAATVANPGGLAVLGYPFQTVSIQFLQKYIQEWQSPDFHVLQAQLFLLLFFLTWAAVAFSPRKTDLLDFLFLTFISYMGFLAWRNTNLLSIVAPAIILRYGQPVLDRYLPQWDPDHAVSKIQSGIHAALVGILLVAVLGLGISSLSAANLEASVRRQSPVDAAAYLASHPVPGRLFNSYNFGSYLLWNLPSMPVFVDGRTDLYDDALLDQYVTVINARDGWRDVLDSWKIGVVFIEPTAPIREVLLAEGWTVYYEDLQAVILIPSSP